MSNSEVDGWGGQTGHPREPAELRPSILKIRQAGESVLRQVARPLRIDEIRSAEVQGLIEMMRETLRDAPGVGLAAPQVGYGLQIAVIEDTPERHAALSAETLAERGRVAIPFQVIINPQLTVVDPSPAWFFEGCLSVSGFTALVPRALRVRVQGYDERAEPVTIDAVGWYARILQHEIDHLRGCLYLDVMESRSFMTQTHYDRTWKNLPIRELASRLDCPGVR